MTEWSGPTGADLRRIGAARIRARSEVELARDVFGDVVRAAFRRELAATIRCASPFLLSLLATDGLALADVVDHIEPMTGWPYHAHSSRLARGRGKRRTAADNLISGPKTRRTRRARGELHGMALPLDDGGWADVRVLGHALEVRMNVGTLIFETVFGELIITAGNGVPAAIAAGAVGRPIEDVVRHPATDGHRWRVRSAERVSSGTAFVIPTGSVPWTIG